MKLEAIQGDITQLKVDAIVNAANNQLCGGAGVDGAIHRAAGPELLAAGLAIAPCPTGQARMTPGFDLAADWVIHTVGPVWAGGHRGEAELLRSCYWESLHLAREKSLANVAFPAISCGVYGYPLAAAADIAVQALRDYGLAYTDAPAQVYLVAFSQEIFQLYQQLLADPG